jgi:GAF domain-containing protein
MCAVLTAIADPERVAGLRRLALLDTPPNPTFDRLTELACQLLEVPMALITLVDSDRQFFLSASGLPEPFRATRQTPLEYSLCQFAVASRRPLIIGDTRTDRGLADNAAVTVLGLAAYAGIPLITEDDHAVGTFCVLDVVARDWTDDQLATLAHLAEITMDEIRPRYQGRIAAIRLGWQGVDGSS